MKEFNLEKAEETGKICSNYRGVAKIEWEE